MASRQLSEGWNHQTRTIRVEGEARKPEPISAAMNPCHGVQMTTDIELIRLWRCLGSMTQPELTQGLRRLLWQAFEPAVPVMIPPNQGDLGSAEIRQGPQGVPQPGRQTDASMNQITQ